MALCFRSHDWGAAIEGLRRLAEGVCAQAGYAPSGRAVKRNLAAVRTPRFFQIVTYGIPVRVCELGVLTSRPPDPPLPARE
jgi:hypothetical protein